MFDEASLEAYTIELLGRMNYTYLHGEDILRDYRDVILEDRIIDLINKDNRITKVKMAKILQVSKTTIERSICISRKIMFVGSSKCGHWKVVE